MPLYDDPTARPDSTVNVGPRLVYPTAGDHHWQEMRPFEAPRGDPAWHEIHVYTDAMSYAAGDTVHFHGSTNAAAWTIEVTRDGLKPTVVHRQEALPGRATPMPANAYEAGCDWPVLHSWTLPDGLASGFYLVEASVSRQQGGRFVQHHFFVVRPFGGAAPGRLLHVLPSCTYIAYNDWGGANHYGGSHGAAGNEMSPLLSTERPWTRGMVKLPENAPRICAAVAEPMMPLRYDFKEWSYANGFSYYYAATGWAQYDRHFAVWAEREGYAVDTITQTDLHLRPELLDAYSCVVVVGHDEYWTREMRLAVESYVERGGHLARFGANFTWQVRLENEGRRQVCYKSNAHRNDPIRATGDDTRLTSAWEDRHVHWPGASTVGGERPRRHLCQLGPLHPAREPGLYCLPARALGFRQYRSDLRRYLRCRGTDLRIRGGRRRLHVPRRVAVSDWAGRHAGHRRDPGDDAGRDVGGAVGKL